MVRLQRVKLRFGRLNLGDGKRNNLEGVESQAVIVALRTLDHGLELPVEVLDNLRKVSLQKDYPGLPRDFQVVVRDFALDVLGVGLVQDHINILVQRVQDLAKKFLRIMLPVPFESGQVALHREFKVSWDHLVI